VTLRIATFNVENMFNRYALLDEPWENRDYEKMVQVVGLVSVASRAGDLVQYSTTEIQRNNTAQAILDTQPDVIALQEVENLYTLRIFNDSYLDNYFDKLLLIDGNDPRGIDVGLMLKKGFAGQIVAIRTHMDDTVAGKTSVERGSRAGFGYLANNALFSRDCLEVDIAVRGKTLTLLVNHLKAQDGTKAATKRRTDQSAQVGKYVDRAVLDGKLPIVLGDLNSAGADGSLKGVLQNQHLQDPFAAIDDKWTHYYVPAKEYSRLDYILPDKRLGVTGHDIIRKGITKKATRVHDRYPTVGLEHTEASDHCPVVIELDV
jgi:endonuclease/exonuclease/phosphatase family metal-dependent hydrolase